MNFENTPWQTVRDYFNVIPNLLSQTYFGTLKQTLHIRLLVVKGKYPVCQWIKHITRIDSGSTRIIKVSNKYMKCIVLLNQVFWDKTKQYKVIPVFYFFYWWPCNGPSLIITNSILQNLFFYRLNKLKFRTSINLTQSVIHST